MSAPLADRFGTVKPVIAMLHFPGLPGRPRHHREGGRQHLLDVVGRDLEILQAAGVDGLLFCNENAARPVSTTPSRFPGCGW